MSTIQLLFCTYYLIINFTAFILFAIDKRRAVRHAWRIRERTLLLTALLGGAAGSLAAMLLFHHKIRKAKFYITVPLLIVIHFFLGAWLLQQTGMALLPIF